MLFDVSYLVDVFKAAGLSSASSL